MAKFVFWSKKMMNNKTQNKNEKNFHKSETKSLFTMKKKIKTVSLQMNDWIKDTTNQPTKQPTKKNRFCGTSVETWFRFKHGLFICLALNNILILSIQVSWHVRVSQWPPLLQLRWLQSLTNVKEIILEWRDEKLKNTLFPPATESS